MKKHLEIWNLGKTYPTPNGPAVIVRGFELVLAEGEFVCIIGHSGCGKSTVLSIVAGLNQATDGTVILGGREVTEAGPDRGVVFQAPCLLPWRTALENVRLGVDQVFGDRSVEKRNEIAAHYLTLVGLGDSLEKRPSELSAGMQQRVGLARAFALSPKLLLLDEPFGMLDSLTRLELQEVLLQLWREDKKTALMVTHDVDEALFLADRIVMMTNGPAARIGDIITCPFERPRNRDKLLEDPGYYALRDKLVGFLEAQAHPTPSEAEPEAETRAAVLLPA